MDNLQIPNFILEKQKQNLEEFSKYQEMAKENVKNSIFDEVRIKERQMAREQENIKRVKFQKFKRYTALTILVLAGSFALKKQIDYTNKPINIVTHDILANEGLLETDNGKTIESKQFSKDEELELYNYIINNNLTNEQVLDNIEKRCKKENIDYNIALNQMKTDYPGLFEIKIEVAK